MSFNHCFPAFPNEGQDFFFLVEMGKMQMMHVKRIMFCDFFLFLYIQLHFTNLKK